MKFVIKIEILLLLYCSINLKKTKLRSEIEHKYVYVGGGVRLEF